MSLGYLLAAVFSGFIGAFIWVYAGGGWWSAVLAYVMTGNLVLVGLVLRGVMRQEKQDPTQASEQTPSATEG